MGFLRRIFQGLIKFVFKIIFIINPNQKFNKNGIVLPDEPVLFLCNHQNNFDAIRLRVQNKRRIVFVAHDELYRNKFFKWVASNLIDTVCRGSGKNDIGYIKELFRAKKNGLSIGIYPEGGINYFNKSTPFDSGTAKLCKKLNMPIVLVSVNGGSFITPRWAKHKAKCVLEYNYQRLITKEEVENLSVEELDNEIKKYIFVNDYDWQRKNMVEIKRKDSAVHLERALFVCPNCKSLHTISTSKNKILCSNCLSEIILDKFDFVQGAGEIDDLVKWDEFQYSTLESIVKNKSTDEILLEYKDVTFNNTKIKEYFKKGNEIQGDLILYKDKIIFKTNNNETIYKTHDISNIYVEFKNTLQFNHIEERIRITDDNFYAYVWVTYLRVLNKISTE